MNAGLAVTWWGHSSTTIELGQVRVGTDPLFANHVAHLRRRGPTPTPAASELDLVLVSHLHADHLHVPSLAGVNRGVPIVVPKGARPYLGAISDRHFVEVEPGDSLDIEGVHLDVLPARHDGRRHPLARIAATAIGFRVDDGSQSFWYPGDTGPSNAMSEVAPVDLAVVPIGGWGPTLGPEHMGPEDAAIAVGRVGARWAVPVHYGTLWPVGLRLVHPANYRRLFVTPGPRFAAAMELSSAAAVVLGHGDRMVLLPRTAS